MPETLQSILRHGGNANEAYPYDSHIRPLLWAHDPVVVHLLLDAGADINFKDDKGMSAIMLRRRDMRLSQQDGDRKIVMLLERYGAKE